MTLSVTLGTTRLQLEGYVGPTNWWLHYDAEQWLTRGRFDMAVVLAQTAFEVTRRRVLAAKPTVRSLMDRRLTAHPLWKRYEELRINARNAFAHEGRRPTGGDATEFVDSVGALMKVMETV